MRRNVAALTILIAAFLMAAPGMSRAEGKQRRYVGVAKCKMCHRKAEQGEQYTIWSKTKHAKAYENLATPKAKELAKKAGVADPQKDGKCLKCHVTAYGVDPQYLGKKYKMEDGVGCESCHGAGGDYAKKSIMKKLTAGEITPESVGLTFPPDEKVCVKCHNDESPVFKGFNFEEAKKKIAHPIPEARKAMYKKG